MRKIYLTLLVLAASLQAGAQTMYDALTFSETHYYGTARSISLGNAMTALGGDLGSVGINPAGSAVNAYGQFTLTPGVSIASGNSSWSTLDNGNYSAGTAESQGRFIFPNTGFTMTWDTGNRSGVKRWSFGFVLNTTENHLARTTAVCPSNPYTSMTGSFGAGASGIEFASLNISDPYNDTSYPWNTVMAVKSEMISTYDTYTDQYLAVTAQVDGSGVISVAGPLSQRALTKTLGCSTDMVMNFGMDVSDKLFLGFNLGIPMMTYSYAETFFENAVNPSDFVLQYEGGGSTNFTGARYRYAYKADVSGIYAKLGLIWVPVTGVRLGAAIKTPTALSIEEEYQVDGLVNYSSASSTSSSSPLGEWEYMLRSPWEANFGAAITVGSLGLLSLDYEMTDYSVMKYSEAHDDGFFDSGRYDKVNRLNSLFCGVQHSLRAGVEVKLLPEFALRAGWTVTTSPEKYYTDNLGLRVDASEYDMLYDDFESGLYTISDGRYIEDKVNSFSLGAGYSSSGSFFMDLAARMTNYPVSYRKPYADYIYDNTGALETASPVIRSTRSLFDIVLTFGWRF